MTHDPNKKNLVRIVRHRYFIVRQEIFSAGYGPFFAQRKPVWSALLSTGLLSRADGR